MSTVDPASGATAPTDPLESAAATGPAAPAGAVARRNLLRGGAVLAGAAGAAALSAVAAQPAQAADGQPVIQGQLNDATSTTTLRIGAGTGGANPTLSLQNANGPSLKLQPLPDDWDGELAVGEIANTEIGPLIGVVDPYGFQSVTFLATEYDLDTVPRPEAISPERIVDTRNAAGRAGIINTPAANFDASGRLLKGKTMSVLVADAGGTFNVSAAFLNVVSTGSLTSGFFTLYPQGTRPLASTINFAQGQTLANGALVALGVLGDYYAFTVYTNATSHVVVDLSGTVFTVEPSATAARRPGAPGVRRPRASRRLPKILSRRR